MRYLAKLRCICGREYRTWEAAGRCMRKHNKKEES